MGKIAIINVLKFKKMKYKIERNHAGKVIGISCPDTAKHDLDFICTLTDEETARRIVTCVNACEGIETEWLEIKGASVAALIAHRDKLAIGADCLRKQNARLLEALRVIAKWELPETGRFWDKEKTEPMSYAAAYGSQGVEDYFKELARKAIAKAEK